MIADCRLMTADFEIVDFWIEIADFGLRLPIGDWPQNRQSAITIDNR
jgi:hypothetical protein